MRKLEMLPSWLQMLVVAFVTGLVVFLAFDNLGKHPGEIMVGIGGDSIKNYYAPVWYVLHDSASHFTGMNYPYGDNLAFADAQPALAFTLQWYHTHVAKLTPSQVIAAVNLSMVIGVWLCAMVVYLLLRQVRLPWLYALVAAIAISLLSPQIQRFYAHYGLSYAFAIPLAWLLAYKVLTVRLYWLWALAVLLMLGTLSMLHLYYLPICGIFVLLLASNHFVFNLRQWSKLLPRVALLVVAIVLPYVAIQGWLAATSDVADRIAVPFGMEVYIASLNSVFFPSYFPLVTGAHGSAEGYGYIGLVAVVATVLVVYRWLGYVIRRRWTKVLLPVMPDFLRYAFWPSVVMLLFGLGIPFLWLKDWLPEGLQQFRSLGRFVWVFYYVMAIYAAVLFFVLFRRLRISHLGRLGGFFLLTALGVWLFEAQVYLRPLQYKINESKNLGYCQWVLGNPSIVSVATEHHIDADRYQAIIPIPFFHGGSDKVGNHPDDEMLMVSVQHALHLDLPMVASSMARTSIGQASNIIQLFSSAYIQREVARHFNSKALLLLVNTKRRLADSEQAMVHKARLLAKVDWLEYYSLPAEMLETPWDNRYNTAIAAMDTLPIVMANMKASATGFYYVDLFDNEANNDGLLGGGAKLSDNDTLWLAKEMDLPKFEDTLEVSFWVKIDTDRYGMGELKGVLKGDMLEYPIWINLALARDVYHGWLRFSCKLPPLETRASLQLYLLGRHLCVDQLLIKPLDSQVYIPTHSNDTVLVNNYFVYP